MSSLLATSTLFVLAAAATAVYAQTAPTDATPRIDRREAHQQARIAQGAASGALTPHEQRRLQREQKAIAKGEAAAKADGVVTPAERHALTHAQNRASRDIRRQKHDAQHRAQPASVPSN